MTARRPAHPLTRPLILLVLAAITTGGGYWLGQQQQSPAMPAAGTTPAGAAPAASGERKILYYRNPMGLPDTSPVPKNDSMGMPYVPVYADAAPAAEAGSISIDPAQVQKLGVRTAAVERRSLDLAVHAAGRIEVDERRIATVAPKFEGWIDKLHVAATGQAVAKGQPLFEVSSPDLLSAQREYLLAAKSGQQLRGSDGETQSGLQQLATASLARLSYWGIGAAQLKALEKSGEVRPTLTISAPVSGIVTEKKAVAGMRFAPGDTLYQIADLSSVWLLADVAEQDIGRISLGGSAKVRLPAYPEREFAGKITFISPTLNGDTRSVPVRVELANADGRLKPAMFASVDLSAKQSAAVLAVPVSAVIDSGQQQTVLIANGDGRFTPRRVKTGQRSGDWLEIRDGLQGGEQVVIAANFLIDAESNLRSALAGMSGGGTAPAKENKDAAASAGHHGEGTLDAIDRKANSVTISHGPIASLKWPAMTMDFQLANASLAEPLRPGAAISFEFVERQPGEWVITSIKARP